MQHNSPSLIAGFLCLFAGTSLALAQGTAFTYQGRLTEGTNAANGAYDLRFVLYKSEADDAPQVGSTLVQEDTPVSGGVFTATLDFGPTAFNGEPRWLEIGVRPGQSTGPYVRLLPRQPVRPAPYAIYALTASNVLANVSEQQLPETVARLNAQQTFSGINSFTNAGNRFAGSFSGNGSGLTALSATQLAGTVPDARLSANVALLNANQTFRGTMSFSPPSGPPFAVGGTGLVANLNAQLFGGYRTTNFWLAGNVPGGLDPDSFWKLVGNAGTIPGQHFVGTTDNKALEFKVNGNRAFRLEPDAEAPNVIGGPTANNVASGVVGATIGGGRANLIQANANYAVIPGGVSNVVAGDHSLAAGSRAKALHRGALVWADGSAGEFASTAPNQFRVRAIGGSEFVTSTDAAGKPLTGVAMSASGGVSVTALSDTNAALELRQGCFKVTGAGSRANAPVFIHRVTSPQTDQLGHVYSVINHPLCNNDPSALLIVTPCLNPGDASGTNQMANWCAVGTFYTGNKNTQITGANQNKWALYFINLVEIAPNAAFNVLVIKP
jgi:hypothetical protein